MRLTACVTTMNRTQELDGCLRALWASSVKPYSVIVSDNSPEFEVQQKNRQIVSQYPTTAYLVGPGSGSCANRNNTLKALTPETDLVAFFADDICVYPDFIAYAVDQYTQMSSQQRTHTILTGDVVSEHSSIYGPYKLSFRGYYLHSDTPQVLAFSSAVFPRLFIEKEQWDENIFLGKDDAELSFRALKLGYRILYRPELKVFDTCPNANVRKTGPLTDFEIYNEASRLYIGIKRFKDQQPNPFKLVAFVVIYFSHMTIYLLRRRQLQIWPEIIRRSNIQRLWTDRSIF